MGPRGPFTPSQKSSEHDLGEPLKDSFDKVFNHGAKDLLLAVRLCTLSMAVTMHAFLANVLLHTLHAEGMKGARRIWMYKRNGEIIQ